MDNKRSKTAFICLVERIPRCSNDLWILYKRINPQSGSDGKLAYRIWDISLFPVL